MTLSKEQLEDAIRCFPHSKDNARFIDCYGVHHKNYLAHFGETILGALYGRGGIYRKEKRSCD